MALCARLMGMGVGGSWQPMLTTCRRPCVARPPLHLHAGAWRLARRRCAAAATAPAALEGPPAAAPAALAPTRAQLRAHFVQSMVPMIGFGFMDNTVMIYAGSAIDATLGVQLGLSTMCAAACGQICSDIAGVSFGGVIGALARKLGLPSPGFTEEQRGTTPVKRVGLIGNLVGVFIGCSLGLTNLLFVDTEEVRELKLAAQDDPDAEEFTVQISNEEREDCTSLSVSGPATKGLLASVVAAVNAADCNILAIEAQAVAMGEYKVRQIFITKDGAQVEDDKLEAIARKALNACRQPERARKLVMRNEALQKENEELRQRLERARERLERHSITVAPKGFGA